jgi:tyrosine decarboxylase/aspartate 1-decarboxylase
VDPDDPDATQLVLHRLEQARAQDAGFRSGQILGSMCTAPHPLAVEAHILFLEANLGDPGHFPGARRLETEYIAHLFRLAGGRPPGADGQVTGGASEANLLALMSMRESTGRRQVVVPATGHFSFQKAAKLLGMHLVIADVDDDYRVRPEAMAAKIGPETAGIVGIAGSTQVGSVDPIEALSDIAQEHELPLHVDAAFGGYVLPFLPEDHPSRARFGFDLPGVTTVAVDSHKMGMGTMGAGALLVRHARLMDHFSVPTPYLSTRRQRGVLGTRSAAPVAAAWALFEALGHHGYRQSVADAMANTRHAAATLDEAGITPLIPPPLNILAVPCRAPVRLQATLAERGWRINVLPRLRAARLVMMPHVTRELLDAFLPDLVAAVAGQKGGETHRAHADAPPAPAP